MKFLTANKRVIVGALAGSVGGYLYYYFVGCASGSCAITSNPYASVVYGAVMGGLIFSLFETKKTTTK